MGKTTSMKTQLLHTLKLRDKAQQGDNNHVY